MSAIPERLEEGVYAWVFGDEEIDPGSLVSDGREVPDFRAWLGELERQIGELKRALGAKVHESVALDRLRALISEVERAEPIRFPAQVRADVSAPVVSIGDFRKRTVRRVGIGAAILALAAAIFLVVRSGGDKGPPDVTAELAAVLTQDIAADSGFGFGGAVEPSARDRGFLIGAVIDLSKQRQSGATAGPAELELARKLATKALMGLDAPDDGEARRQRALGGCAAVFGDDPERGECEQGLSAYLTARDNVIR